MCMYIEKYKNLDEIESPMLHAETKFTQLIINAVLLLFNFQLLDPISLLFTFMLFFLLSLYKSNKVGIMK